MDIGTAKPTTKEQLEIPHHLIDLVEPNETFSLVDFQRIHDSVRAKIEERHGIPVLVGGTGLYAVSYTHLTLPTKRIV